MKPALDLREPLELIEMADRALSCVQHDASVTEPWIANEISRARTILRVLAGCDALRRMQPKPTEK
jgi:hypothetical protein